MIEEIIFLIQFLIFVNVSVLILREGLYFGLGCYFFFCSFSVINMFILKVEVFLYSYILLR